MSNSRMQQNNSNFDPYSDIGSLETYDKNLKMYEKRIGNVQIPNDRYGRGGTRGDLPRDFEIFNQQQTEYVDDYPDNRNSPRRGQIVPNKYYTRMLTKNLKLQSLDNSRMRNNIGVKGGPRDDTYDDVSVVGVDGMIDPEENIMSTPGEEFALVDNEELNSHECTSCTNQDETYVNTYDDYRRDDFNVSYNADDEGEEYNQESNSKQSDANNVVTDNTYKYLFFLSLLVLIYLIYSRQ